MPLLDLNLAVVVDQHGQPSVHLTIDTKWLSFSNVQHARALKNLAPCIESDKTEYHDAPRRGTKSRETDKVRCLVGGWSRNVGTNAGRPTPSDSRTA